MTIRSAHAAMLAAALALLLAPAASSNDAPDNALSAEDAAAGWTLLFDGRSTEHFRGYRKPEFPASGWIVSDGSLHRAPGPAPGDIVTREQFGDFEFACEWRIAPGGNSGIIYRCTEDKANAWETGPEMQILDDAAHGDGAEPDTRAGALYDLVPCSQSVVRPAGEWNEARIVARGSRIEHWLNGVKVVDVDLASDAYRKAHARSKWVAMPDFGARPRGHIAFQDHGDEVWFRNIRVRRLD